MIDVLRKKRPLSSVLGLAFDGARLDGVVLRRSTGSIQVKKAFGATLALNPLTGDPELVGREIRNHLEQAGIREKQCVVCLPLAWALALQVKLPELAESDIESFLQLEAERGFPYGQESLLLSTSRYKTVAGESFATLVGVQRSQVEHLEKALKAAGLRAVSFTLGITALQTSGSETAQGVVTVATGENNVDLQVTFAGGVVALRALEEAMETEEGHKRFSAEAIAREIRITLGQLPAEIRTATRTVRVFSRGELGDEFSSQMKAKVLAMGMQFDRVRSASSHALRDQLPSETEITPALAAAAEFLTDSSSEFEFLPPRITAWQQMSKRFKTKKFGSIGATVGVIFFLVAAAFGFQQYQLTQLNNRWAALEPKVKQLESFQQQIRKYRPWFDESFVSLSILKKITETFPEDGTVTAKRIEIRGSSTIMCTGTARDPAAVLKVTDQLRNSPQISGVSIDSIKGKSPQVTFSFNVQWGEPANGN